MNELNPKTQEILDKRLIPAMRDLMLNRDELADAWNKADQATAIKALMKKYLERYFPGMEDVQKRVIEQVAKIKDEPRKMNSLARFLSGEISPSGDFDPDEFLRDMISEIAAMRNQNDFAAAAYGAKFALGDSRQKDLLKRHSSLLPRIFPKDKNYEFEFKTQMPGREKFQELRIPKQRTRKEIIQEEITTKRPMQPQALKIKDATGQKKTETVPDMKQAQEEQQRMNAYNDELAQDLAQKAQELAKMEGKKREIAIRRKSFMEKVASGKGIATAVLGGGLTIGGVIGTMLSSGTN